MKNSKKVLSLALLCTLVSGCSFNVSSKKSSSSQKVETSSQSTSLVSSQEVVSSKVENATYETIEKEIMPLKSKLGELVADDFYSINCEQSNYMNAEGKVGLENENESRTIYNKLLINHDAKDAREFFEACLGETPITEVDSSKVDTVIYGFKEETFNSYYDGEVYDYFYRSEILDDYKNMMGYWNDTSSYPENCQGDSYSLDNSNLFDFVLTMIQMENSIATIKDMALDEIYNMLLTSEDSDMTMIASLIDVLLINTEKLLNGELAPSDYVDALFIKAQEVFCLFETEEEFNAFKETSYYSLIINAVSTLLITNENILNFTYKDGEFNLSFNLDALNRVISTLVETSLLLIKDKTDEDSMMLKQVIGIIKMVNDEILKHVDATSKIKFILTDTSAAIEMGATVSINVDSISDQLASEMFGNADVDTYNCQAGIEMNLAISQTELEIPKINI